MTITTMLFNSLLVALFLAVSISTTIVVLAQQQQDDNEFTSCQLCPFGGTMANPNKPIYDINEFSTCGEIDSLVLAPLPRATCMDALGIIEATPFDFRDYCECSNYRGPEICSLCEEGEVLKNENEPLDMLGGYTCKEISDLAESSRDESACAEMAEAVPFCCEAPPPGDIIEPETPQQNQTDTITDGTPAPGTDLCFLCENNTQFLNPDRKIFLLENLPCSRYNLALQWYALYPMCDIFPFFDTRAFCGCEGVTDPPESGCDNFCSVVTEPDKEVYVEAINMTLTCTDIGHLATYSTDDSLCDMYAKYESVCCPGATDDTSDDQDADPSDSSDGDASDGTDSSQQPPPPEQPDEPTPAPSIRGSTSGAFLSAPRPTGIALASISCLLVVIITTLW